MKNYAEGAVLDNVVEHSVEEKFREYVDFFSLDEEDLQKSILDVGTGAGDFVKYLRGVVGNKNVYGVERDEDKIKPDTDGVFVADGMELPFDTETFDLVIAKHYLPIFIGKDNSVVENVLSELIRVLKPGGKVLADVMTYDEYLGFSKKDDGIEHDVFLNKKIEGTNHFFRILKEIKDSGVDISYSKNQKGDNILTIRK